MTLMSFIGDFGLFNKNLGNICKQIKDSKSDYTFLLGDCFYPNGLQSSSIDDQLYIFDTFFKNVNNRYMILGNHDHMSDIKSEYLNNNHWNMPNYFYKVSINNDIDVFCIDTCVLDDIMQMKWLIHSLYSCKKKYKIVVGHYHIISNGMYTNQRETQILRRLFKATNVSLYVCGHDHLLFHKYIDGFRRDDSKEGPSFLALNTHYLTFFVHHNPKTLQIINFHVILPL